MADKINAAGYETKPWWPYVRELMEGGGSVTVEQLNVTENGTYTAEEGKAYSPVVVNVEGGSGDLSTATVTVVGLTDPSHCLMPVITVDPEYGIEGVMYRPMMSAQSYETILYKGKCYASFTNVSSVSGDVELDSDSGLYVITGDCTVTFGGGPI